MRSSMMSTPLFYDPSIWKEDFVSTLAVARQAATCHTHQEAQTFLMDYAAWYRRQYESNGNPTTTIEALACALSCMPLVLHYVESMVGYSGYLCSRTLFQEVVAEIKPGWKV